MQKIHFIMCAAILALSACDKDQKTAGAKQPLYYKEGVSDKQMTRDLNECASIAYKGSLESGRDYHGGPKADCMRAKGYDQFYN
jgi:hypothetical protein